MKTKIVVFCLILVSFSFIGKVKTYKETKVEIQVTRAKIKNINLSKDSIGKIFTEQLVNKIFTYWYGTKWSFEGHTSVPKKGRIACGYFVSTTLRDVGLNLNRYKLARKSPLDEANFLKQKYPVLILENETIEENITQIKSTLNEGIYFLGFDQSHVGFILKEDTSVFVIHSNYINSQGVVKEKIENSLAFSHYLKFYIVPISRNKPLIRKWISGMKVY